MDQSTGQEEATDASRIWLPVILACIARFLSPNEVASTLRLVNRATYEQFQLLKIVRLSLPTPVHVFKSRWGSPASFRAYTYHQRKALLRLTAASGCLANLRVALDNAGLLVEGELLEAAAAAGHLDVCRGLLRLGYRWGRALVSAAAAGHAHVCEWLLASGCPIDRAALEEAARNGHEALTLWLALRWPDLQSSSGNNSTSSSGTDGTRRTAVGALLLCAAEGFDLPAFQRLHRQLLQPTQAPPTSNSGPQPPLQPQGPPAGTAALPAPVVLTPEQHGRILSAAAAGPSPDWQAKVEWLEALGYPRTADATDFAVTADPRRPPGAAARLRWLHDRGYPLHDAAAGRAAARGDVVALTAIAELWGPEAVVGADTAVAALRGHLGVLQLMVASGAALDAQAEAYRAAGGGHLPVVVWAVESLGGVSPEGARPLLDMAASSGRLELVAWLRARGWGWGRETMTQAAWGGCEEALEWLAAQGCPWPTDGRPYINAALHRDPATARCLRRLGCPWRPRLLNTAIRCGVPVAMLDCLLGLGCPVDWQEARRQAEMVLAGRRPDLVEWVAAQRQRRRRGAPGPQQ